MIAFAHIQKTAGTTIHWILQRSFGLRHCAVEPWRPFAGKLYFETAYDAEDHRKLQRIYPRFESIAGHLVKPHSNLHEARPDVRYYTFLRDPLKRQASHYQAMVQRMGYAQSFDRWLEDERFHDLQVKHLGGSADVDAAKQMIRERCFFVGLQERFDESLVLLQQRAALPKLDVRYTPENIAPDASIAKQLLADPRTRAQLEETTRGDQALYDWVAEDFFPEQCREYGAGLEQAAASLRVPNMPRYNLNAFLTRAMKYAVMRPLMRRAQTARPDAS